MLKSIKKLPFVGSLLLALIGGAVSAQEEMTAAADLKEPELLILHGEIATPIIIPPGNVVPDHIEAFGFYHSGKYVDYISEVAPFSTFINLHWSNVDEKLAEAKRHGVKVWVELGPIFFNTSSGHTRQEDYLELWESAKEKLKPYEDIIYALDPLDEPFNRSSMSYGEVKEYLDEIGLILMRDFPDAYRALTFTEKSVEEILFWQRIVGWDPINQVWEFSEYSEYMPINYNLFGVDKYKGVNFQGGMTDLLRENVEKVREHTGALQDAKFYIIPRAFMTDNTTYGYLTEEQLITRAQQAYDHAVRNEDVIAIYPFAWPEVYASKGTLYGPRYVPEVEEQYRKIGKAVKLFRD
ncbi:hypothetical protein [Microbulbifer sp. JTAC008]|uniref:hypothetical protein n=1 Tax=unclassified Microbulbifer TaxID=2619833 RepID=UPI002B2E23FF|nr:hypothetical protein QT397_10715 [Microbulbifer sp. MKSA007]